MDDAKRALLELHTGLDAALMRACHTTPTARAAQVYEIHERAVAAMIVLGLAPSPETVVLAIPIADAALNALSNLT